MIRVPLDDVPEEVANGWAAAARWCDEVRFVRDELGGWWVKVVQVERSHPSPHEWTARAGWFALSVGSDFEMAIHDWLDDAIGNVDGDR